MYICFHLTEIVSYMRYIFLFFISVISYSQIKTVVFHSIDAAIEINPVMRNVKGTCQFTFEVKDQTDTIRIDAQKMEFKNVKINKKTVVFKNNKSQLLLFDGFTKGENTLTFEYEAFPTQTMYFVNWDFSKENANPEDNKGQIWTQGQGKYTSNWLPSFDDVTIKVIFNFNITFQKSFEVISNGTLLTKTPNNDNIVWQFQMKKPMSSYLAMVAIGHFNTAKESAASGIPLYYYYENEDVNCIALTYRDSKKVFDFFEKEIGVPYPWEVYRQIPVRDFLYAGMENTTATVFSRDFVVDSIGYNDRKYLNVNAHELAHQWFGDLVTAQSGKDHWLQEGFATYYALLAEKEVFGDAYFYYKMYTNAMQIKEASKTDTIPILDLKASSLSYYQKGAWALHVIRETIGREKFNLAVKNYLTKYAFKNVTTSDFLNEIIAVAPFDSNSFRKNWLEQAAFQDAAVAELLSKNEFVTTYIQNIKKPLNLVSEMPKILKIMESSVYYPLKELLVYQNSNQDFEIIKPILKAALKTNSVEVRQAVAGSVATIPESFRMEYETLLYDKSYETQEIALFNLWKQFPEHQKKYLEIAKNWVGFQDKNLKLLYLTLFIMTPEANKEKESENKIEKIKAYQKLLSFTGTNYDSGLQQHALEKLLSLKIYTEDVLKSLVYGLGNHRWQFVKFSKETIRKLLKDKFNREIFIKIGSNLAIREKTQLLRLLNE